MTVALRITADDYGIAPGVSAGIRELLDAGRLSGTSAMTTFDLWPMEGVRLRPFTKTSMLGVHLTLTDHAPLGPMPKLAPQGRFPSFGGLARAAWMGALDADEIEAELRRQIDAFQSVVGRAPDYLDGHHHVQQLPVVRDAVLKLMRERMPAHAWVRTCVESMGPILSRRVGVSRAIAFAQVGRWLDAAARAADVGTNDGFTGLYDVSPDVPYGERFERFVRRVGEGTALLVHPGWRDDVLRARDTLTAARENELRFLAGKEMPGMLTYANARVATRADLHPLPSAAIASAADVAPSGSWGKRS